MHPPENAPAFPAYPPSMAVKKSPACAGLFMFPATASRSVLDLQLGAAVTLTTFGRVVGVDRLALAKALRTIQTAGFDAVRDQVVVHTLGAALRQLLVVGVRTDGIG